MEKIELQHQEVEVGRFESVGDVRQVFVGRDAQGTRVRQEVRGPSSEVAFGEEAHTLRIALEADQAARLERCLVAFGGIEGFLRSEERDLIDLMDLCDREGVAYAFWSEGPRTGTYFRAAAAPVS